MNCRSRSLLFLLAFFYCDAVAQNAIPFSRFGIGVLQNPEPTWMKGWGSLSAAFQNPYNVNYQNPASYSNLSFTCFETGLYGGFLKIKSAPDTSATFTDGGISQMVLGLPVIKEKLGISFGITPFSRVEYDITQQNDTSSGFGVSANNFTGEGGLYKFHLGTGYKWKNLSVGINAAYLFGQLSYSTILAFPDSLNAFGTIRDESRVFGDFVFQGGLQYRLILDDEKKYYLDFGLTGDLKTNVSATRELLYSRYTLYDENGFQQSTPQVKDTISEVNEDGEVVFPPKITGGIIFTEANHIMLGIHYDYAKWSEYTSFGESDFTTDSWRLGFGVQWIPAFESYNQYHKLIAYRAGFSAGKNYLQFDEENLLQYTASFGAGFPIRRMLSEISFAAEWYKLGNLSQNPLAISNFRFSLGMTLNDRWFQKRKFD
jgi:hypothetical protein